MTAFWETWAAAIAKHWGSWGVEIVSGLILATVMQFLLDGWLAQVLACTVASCVYEDFIDPNGWSWTDILQRSVGIGLGLVIWGLIR